MSDGTVPLLRTRRGLLTAAAAAAGTAAITLARPGASLAADPNDLVLGTDNPATAMTQITKSGSTTGFRVVAATAVAIEASSTSSIGLSGWSASSIGVWGVSMTGPGVRGDSSTLAGVYGRGIGEAAMGVWGEGANTGESDHFGVYGTAGGTGGRAVCGLSTALAGGTGVWGETNNGTGVAVRGYAWDNGLGAFGTGLLGSSGSSASPPPAARTDTGVFGITPTGDGVVGQTASGTGVRARATGSGRALVVEGRAAFSTAARATVAAGRRSVRVTRPDVTASSMVLATLQQKRSGVHVASVVPTSGSFVIYLNKAVGSDTRIAYFIVE